MQQISVHTKIFLYPTEEGGRKRPIVSGYRPNIGFPSGKITDAYCMFEGNPINPGETRNIKLSFFLDSLKDYPLANLTLFTIQEGAKKIGHGVVHNFRIAQREEISIL